MASNHLPPASLTQAEAQSPIWRKLKMQLAARRDELRDSLEQPQTDEATASLRGKCALIREILALEADPAKRPPPQERRASVDAF